MEKKERFCPQISTAQTVLTTQERQNLVKGKVLPSDNNNPNRIDYPRETEPAEKKEMFCLQITTAHIRMTKPGKKLKNEGSSLTEISQGTKD